MVAVGGHDGIVADTSDKRDGVRGRSSAGCADKGAYAVAHSPADRVVRFPADLACVGDLLLDRPPPYPRLHD
ncbi:hypothetical protein [Streptomyces sp. NPDC054866]